MIQVKLFDPVDEKGLNAFLKKTVVQSVVVLSEKVTVIFEDDAPLTDIERKAAFRKQINGLENKLMEAEVNYALTKAEISKKTPKNELLEKHEGNRRAVEDNKKILKVLTDMHDSYDA